MRGGGWTEREWVTSSKTHPVTTANRHIGEIMRRCHIGEFLLTMAVTLAIFLNKDASSSVVKDRNAIETQNVGISQQE